MSYSSTKPLLTAYWPYAVPQAQAYQFAARLEAEIVGVHFAPVTQHQPAQHFNLFRFAGGITFKRDVMGQQFDGLPVIPLVLSFWHSATVSRRKTYVELR